MTGTRVLHLTDRSRVAVAPFDEGARTPGAEAAPAGGPGEGGDPAAPLWRRRESAAARTVLRRLLADFGAAGEPIAARPGGQPHLPGRPDLAISLSHTAGWVAAAVQAGDAPAVGVDIEMPVRVGVRMIARCTAPGDRDVLAGFPEPRRAYEFTAIWTVQEACVKAAGTGLAGRPWTVPVRVGQRSGRWGPYRWRCLRDEFPLPVSCAFRHEG